MHGKKREEYKAKLRDDKTAAALAHKANQWHALCRGLSERRRQQQTNDDDSSSLETIQETQTLLEKALTVNPDPNHLWNHRRELMLLLIRRRQQHQTQGDDDDFDFDLSTELKLVQAALMRNPKAYGAWFHRKWCLAVSSQKTTSTTLWQQELALTAQFLQLDERNFHCWNYRRFIISGLLQGGSFWNETETETDESKGKVVECGSWNVVGRKCNVEIPMGAQLVLQEQLRPSSKQGSDTAGGSSNNNDANNISKLLQSEWDFSTQKIQDNFSNFSAFHYRSVLLPWKLQSSGDDQAQSQIMEEELQLVENAFCTEPDDQTSWWYHAFLLDMIDNKSNDKSFSVERARLEEQAALLRDLQEDSPGKWVLLGLQRLLQSIGPDTVEEQMQVLEQLSEMDPDRSGRYQSLQQQCSRSVSAQ